MKIKTSELTGIALDWAVAKCECPKGVSSDNYWEESYLPSTNWAQGGPIIEREGIAIYIDDAEAAWHWGAGIYHPLKFTGFGSTPLIAAMRCYIASKLGNEIEIPEELL